MSFDQTATRASSCRYRQTVDHREVSIEKGFSKAPVEGILRLLPVEMSSAREEIGRQFERFVLQELRVLPLINSSRSLRSYLSRDQQFGDLGEKTRRDLLECTPRIKPLV